MKFYSFSSLIVMVMASEVSSSDNSGRLIDNKNGEVTAKAWNIETMLSEFGDDFEEQVASVKWSTYPESDLLKSAGKDDSGIAMSGGGVRSYLSSLGYLRGLHDLGLLKKTRYLSTVSGGSWANVVYSYFQEEKVGLSIERFLGEILEPETLSFRVLNQMEEKCARNSPVKKDFLMVILLKLLFGGMNPRDIYTSTVAEVFLSPAGIEEDVQPCWSPEILENITARNPHLQNEKFVFPASKDRPFPILNAAVLGPKVAVPFNVKDDDYMPIEFNSLYVGSPQYHVLQYDAKNPKSGEKIKLNMTIGGFVEPFGFGGQLRANKIDEDESEFPKPFFGLGPDKYTGVLHNVPSPDKLFGLANATAASSFAPGSILAGSPLLKFLDDDIGMEVEYWSPVTRDPLEPVFSMPIFVADGASLENNGFLSILRRRMKEIVVFVNSPTPLKPKSEYNPFQRQPQVTDIDQAFSCFFGIDHEHASTAENLYHNQVFPRYEFPRIVDKMQKAQQRGRGIVVREELTTVENAYWGIPAGHKVNVTWVYLGRCREWEKKLPKTVRNKVVPKHNPENPSRVREDGAFKAFPHFPTQTLHYGKQQANLVSNLAGWVIRQNAHIFQQALAQEINDIKISIPNQSEMS